MCSWRLPTLMLGLTAALFGMAAGTVVAPLDRQEAAGRDRFLEALRLPDRAFASQNSRGWQFLEAPTAPGNYRVLAAGDGLYWNCELRTLIKRNPRSTPLVGMVFHYAGEGDYGVMLWDTRTGLLMLRTLRHHHAREIARGKAAYGNRPWASLVLRVVMGEITGYINGEKVLSGSESSLLGRVAVFAVGDKVLLDGLEVRALLADESDSNVFARGRAEYEVGCATCHALNGPWNCRYAPDDWEGTVNQMLSTEGAGVFLSRREADRITDYLRIISLHPNPDRYRPRQTQDSLE